MVLDNVFMVQIVELLTVYLNWFPSPDIYQCWACLFNSHI